MLILLNSEFATKKKFSTEILKFFQKSNQIETLKTTTLRRHQKQTTLCIGIGVMFAGSANEPLLVDIL